MADPILNLIPSSSEVSNILKSVQDPDCALEFFRFAASLPCFRHDCFTNNRILSILDKAGEKYVQSIREILDEMDRDGVRGSISTVNILISIVGGGEIDRCLEHVKKWNLMFTGYTYKCLMQAYVRFLDVKGAFWTYE